MHYGLAICATVLVTMHREDFFLHFSNVLLLVSYSARNMLWLRWFAVGASVIEMPYFLLQRSILWPPVLWGVVFTGINLYQIAVLCLQRRPVVLSKDEQKLYALGFHSMLPRDFVSLVLAGEWKSAEPGDHPVTEGELVPAVCVAIRGTVRMSRKGQDLGIIPAGRIIGTSSALTGNPSPVTASFVEPGRYIHWPLSNIEALLEKRPDLRETVQGLVSRDLAAKLESALSRERAASSTLPDVQAPSNHPQL